MRFPIASKGLKSLSHTTRKPKTWKEVIFMNPKILALIAGTVLSVASQVLIVRGTRA